MIMALTWHNALRASVPSGLYMGTHEPVFVALCGSEGP